MIRTRLRGPSPLLVLLVVLGIVLGACSSDDSADDGVAPTSTEARETTTTDEEPDPNANPYDAAIEAAVEALGVVAIRSEDGRIVLVMEDGATEAQIGPACEQVSALLNGADNVSTDLAGVVAPCP